MSGLTQYVAKAVTVVSRRPFHDESDPGFIDRPLGEAKQKHGGRRGFTTPTMLQLARYVYALTPNGRVLVVHGTAVVVMCVVASVAAIDRRRGS